MSTQPATLESLQQYLKDRDMVVDGKLAEISTAIAQLASTQAAAVAKSEKKAPTTVENKTGGAAPTVIKPAPNKASHMAKLFANEQYRRETIDKLKSADPHAFAAQLVMLKHNNVQCDETNVYTFDAAMLCKHLFPVLEKAKKDTLWKKYADEVSDDWRKSKTAPAPVAPAAPIAQEPGTPPATD